MPPGFEILSTYRRTVALAVRLHVGPSYNPLFPEARPVMERGELLADPSTGGLGRSEIKPIIACRYLSELAA